MDGSRPRTAAATTLRVSGEDGERGKEERRVRVVGGGGGATKRGGRVVGARDSDNKMRDTHRAWGATATAETPPMAGGTASACRPSAALMVLSPLPERVRRTFCAVVGREEREKREGER